MNSYCTICLDESKDKDEEVYSFPCVHVFHMTCAKEWIARNSGCPLCDTKISETEQQQIKKEQEKQNDNNNGDQNEKDEKTPDQNDKKTPEKDEKDNEKKDPNNNNNNNNIIPSIPSVIKVEDVTNRINTGRIFHESLGGAGRRCEFQRCCRNITDETYKIITYADGTQQLSPKVVSTYKIQTCPQWVSGRGVNNCPSCGV